MSILVQLWVVIAKDIELTTRETVTAREIPAAIEAIAAIVRLAVTNHLSKSEA